MTKKIEDVEGEILDLKNRVSYGEQFHNVFVCINDQEHRVSSVEKDVGIIKTDVLYIKEKQEKYEKNQEKMRDQVNIIKETVLTNSLQFGTLSDNINKFMVENKETIPKANRAIKNTFRTMILIGGFVGIFMSWITIRLFDTQDENIKMKIESEVSKIERIKRSNIIQGLEKKGIKVNKHEFEKQQ